MAKSSANYEVMYIVDLDKGEEGVAAIVEKFKTLIEENGTITEMEEMGKRKLAYEIDGQAEGEYTLIDFHADPASIEELNRVLRITDGVMRHMIVARADRD